MNKLLWETPRQQQRETVRQLFFFPSPSSGHMTKCDWTCLATVALVQESQISQGSPLLLQQDTHYMKNVELWSERPGGKWKVDCGGLEWRPSDVLAAGLTQSACWNQVCFFPLFHCLEKKNYKTPFYACYGWPSVCTSTALGNGRRRQREICGCSEERGGEVMLGWKKETKMRWKALTEEDDLLWWEPRTERRRYFIS